MLRIKKQQINRFLQMILKHIPHYEPPIPKPYEHKVDSVKLSASRKRRTVSD